VLEIADQLPEDPSLFGIFDATVSLLHQRLSLIFNLYVVAAPTWLMSTFGCFPTV
jgi:hypothetical protein